LVDAYKKADAMFEASLVRPALAFGALLALSGCYTVPGAVGPVPIVPASPVVERGRAGSDARLVGYAGTTCSAGFYICQVPLGPVGSPCSCPAIGAPSFGTIRK
jgi:hypothetical protein